MGEDGAALFADSGEDDNSRLGRLAFPSWLELELAADLGGVNVHAALLDDHLIDPAFGQRTPHGLNPGGQNVLHSVLRNGLGNRPFSRTIAGQVRNRLMNPVRTQRTAQSLHQAGPNNSPVRLKQVVADGGDRHLVSRQISFRHREGAFVTHDERSSPFTFLRVTVKQRNLNNIAPVRCPLRLPTVRHKTVFQSGTEFDADTRHAPGSGKSPGQTWRKSLRIRQAERGTISVRPTAPRRIQPQRISASKIKILRAGVLGNRIKRPQVVCGECGGDLVSITRVHRRLTDTGKGQSVSPNATAKVSNQPRPTPVHALGMHRSNRQTGGLSQSVAGEQHRIGKRSELASCLNPQLRLRHNGRRNFRRQPLLAQPLLCLHFLGTAVLNRVENSQHIRVEQGSGSLRIHALEPIG